MKDLLEERGRALEETFFYLAENTLLEKIKKEEADTDLREHLKMITGIEGQSSLDNLISLNITTSSVMALTYIPFIAVAWADGAIEDFEKAIILNKAKAELGHNSLETIELLNNWLTERPSDLLLNVWKEYVWAFKKNHTSAEYTAFTREVIHFSHDIASIAGGIFGIGYESKSEKDLITSFENLFESI